MVLALASTWQDTHGQRTQCPQSAQCQIATSLTAQKPWASPYLLGAVVVAGIAAVGIGGPAVVAGTAVAGDGAAGTEMADASEAVPAEG